MRQAALVLAVLAGPAAAQGFDAVGALFADRCVICHSGEDAPLGLRLDTREGVLAGSENGPVVLAGDPASPLLQRLRGEAEPQMPLDGPPFLDRDQITMVEAWVMAGMPAGAAAPSPAADRRRPAPGEQVLWPDVQPIFLKACIKCHSDNSKLGAPPEGLRLDSLENVLKGGHRLAVLPGNPEMSEIWRRVTGLATPRMPFDGPPWLPDEDIRLIRDWIEQGAPDADGTKAPIPTGARIRLRGVLTGAAEIDGAGFVIDSGTRVDDRPRIGDQAEMRGVVQADGSVRAERFRDR
ncbi:c-type cytochrome domain-containing protein [Tabrizicola sp. YIM 78059]|uniref:c-type cytochrome domain-containing protein n=1 Tax=Tabrizicola sp. YIM 78059 TaxID=2529861 RepID=UPI0010AA1202|nr:c-type cytochrome domain-containing protein [Tabrizicola sp. YIM 78059]